MTKSRKYLFLALFSSLLSLLCLSQIVWAAPQQQSDTGSAVLNLYDYSTLSISLSGEAESLVCSSGLIAGVKNDVCIQYSNYASSDYIKITDWTGNGSTGHTVSLKFDSGTWVYDDTNPIYGDVAVATSYNANDVIRFYWDSTTNSGYRTFAIKSGYTCTADTTSSGMRMNDRILTTLDQTVFYTGTNTCPGDYYYTPYRVYAHAGNNGLGEGSYTNSATYTLTDGI
ncbi:hypothetical protein GF354_04340 [Candidatus Peregrinibacteria bacterium]|nr:hypothetical protein [Candidatus Peregrinibacteria bacterium]